MNNTANENVSFFKYRGMLGLKVNQPGYYTVKINGYINRTCLSSSLDILNIKRARFNNLRNDDVFVAENNSLNQLIDDIMNTSRTYRTISSLQDEDLLGMHTLKIPSMERIETGFLSNCYDLRSVILPDDGSLTSIGESAFCNCAMLTSINIPDSVKLIGKDAFKNCDNARVIRYPSDAVVEDGAFSLSSAVLAIESEYEPFGDQPMLLAANSSDKTNKISAMLDGLSSESVEDRCEKLTADVYSIYKNNLHGYDNIMYEGLSGKVSIKKYIWARLQVGEKFNAFIGFID